MVDAEHSINRLTGEWHVSMVFRMEDGSTAKGNGTVKARSISLGRGVEFVLKGDLEGIGTYVEDSMVAYDPESDRVHQFIVTSMGIVHVHTGQFTGEDRLVLRWKGTMQGDPADQEIVVNFRSENELLIQQTTNIEGRGTISGEYAMHRTGRPVLEEPVPSFA